MWRQACFTLFLLVLTGFFAVVTRFGPVFRLDRYNFYGPMTLLDMDQIFEWSRLLKTDHRGYSFFVDGFGTKGLNILKSMIFNTVEFAGKKLLTVILKVACSEKENSLISRFLFPVYGQPIEEVLKIIRSQIDRTPRRRISE